ncbi:dimethylaniline monooxygenase (N-oxide forming) [Pseudohyphozyma bogoriensis]|nr:dimethylaniline monooxygenase (N-oxide forming) [Pseudohyphozyma bogoriensis]
MGSIAPTTSGMQRKRVCVIGAGSTGLAALHELKEAGLDATAYEARGDIGGAWRFEQEAGECVLDLGHKEGFRLTSPGEGEPFGLSHPTPIYQGLRTNVPSTLMAFRGRPFPANTPLFPDAKTVETYLRETAADVSDHIVLNTRVTNLRWTKPEDGGEQKRWIVEVSNTVTKTSTLEQFDFVVVGNGHYSKPNLPSKEELDLSAWKGKVLHARWYREPGQFKDEVTPHNVLVVGNSASGYDITREVATMIHERRTAGDPTVEGRFVAQSFRSPSLLSFPFDSPDAKEYAKEIKLMPAIQRVEGKTVYFVDGQILENVDTILFATGYLYSFPFADPTSAPFNTHPLTLPLPGSTDLTSGRRVHHLDERQIFYLPDPTLALPLTHILIITFPFAQIQLRLVAARFSGRLEVPILPGIPEDYPEDRTPHLVPVPTEHDYTDAILRELGEGKDEFSKWCKVPGVNRDLRAGGKILRKALLGY